MSKKLITYPKNIEVVTEIARAAAKVYNHKTPLLLKEDIEQKPFYKKYLIRKKLLEEDIEQKPFYKKIFNKKKLNSTFKYLSKKISKK